MKTWFGAKEDADLMNRFKSSPLHELLLWHARRNASAPNNEEAEEDRLNDQPCFLRRWWRTSTERGQNQSFDMDSRNGYDLSSSATALRVFVEAYPEQANSMGLVRSLATKGMTNEAEEIGRFLVKVFPQQLGMRNNQGRVPLHHTALRGSPEHVSLLIDEGMKQQVGGVQEGGGLFVRDNGNYNPLDLCVENFCRTFCSDLLREWRYYNDDPRCFQRMHKADEGAEWSKLKIMATAAYSVLCGVQGTVLHALIFLDVAPKLIRYALKREPELLQMRDGDGRLPLHLATMKARPPTEIVELLLDCDKKQHTKTASMADKFGRIPLHAAAVGGWEFDDGIRYLFDADPATLEIRDEGSKMFPFMLSAVADGASIDTVYKLLTAAPSVLKEFSHA